MDKEKIYMVIKNNVYAYASENGIKLFTTNKELAEKKVQEFTSKNKNDTYYYTVKEFPLDTELDI